MIRAALLAVNAKYVHSSLAVWCLSAGVERYARFQHDISVFEATIHQDAADIISQIAAYAPEVVGISAYIWNAAKLKELLRLFRERLPEAVLVLGGPEASFNAEHWLALGADYVLKGEGERSFAALLDTLASGSHDTVSDQPPPDEPVDPYSGTYFDTLNHRIAYLETSRGCPFSCAFCLSGGSKPRLFPLEYAKRQLTRLSHSGTRTVKLVDRTFNCDTDRAYTLFSHVIGLDTTVCFHFEVAADLFDSRTLSLLQTAPPGRIQLEIGVQSFHVPALNAVSRRTDLERVERSLRVLLNGGNIHIHIDLIAGLPYETLADFERGFNRAYALGAHNLQLGFLKLLHGSALRERAELLGLRYDPEPPYEIIGSPWLSAEDLRLLKQTENALQRAYNKGRFTETLRYSLSVSDLNPFAFYRGLGEAAPGHGGQLDAYAEMLFAYCLGLPGVEACVLRDRMTCDWLRATRGENLPACLRTRDRRRKQVAAAAEAGLGHRVQRCETAVLTAGSTVRGVVADSLGRNPVTGLYELHFMALEPGNEE